MNLDKDRQALVKRIRERQKILKDAGKELKRHFVGIDSIIDRVIKNIEIWYVMPELLTRPIIVNLFGLTGVGKTDLVRRLVKLLGFYDKFCEIQLTNKGSAAHPWQSTISGILSSSTNITSGKPAILLLDEIQRFRTINEEGQELHDYKFQDLWELLSDGQLPFEADMDYLMRMMFDFQKEDIHEKQNKLISQKMGDRPEKPKKRIIKKPRSVSGKVVEGVSPSLVEEEEENDEDAEVRSEYFSSYYTLTSFKRILRLKESIEEIALWDNAKKRAVISSRLEDPNFFEQEDYSKLLIFISGNLDEAFHKFADKTNEADIDADTFHKNSLKITVLDIKAALQRRFKPEQIARLGNVHIIYPSLSKFSYQTIIQRKINDIVDDIRSRFGIRVVVDKSIKKLIYDNGVYPVQGTRPVFSTISEILENNLPVFLFRCFIRGGKTVKVYYDDHKICGKTEDGSVHRVSFVGSLDEIKIKQNKDYNKRMVVSVHEAGHAVAYAKLFGLVPVQLNSNATSLEGFIGKHSMEESQDHCSKELIVGLAGYVSEEIIFGKEQMTTGARHDIETTTNTAASMIRKSGMKNALPMNTSHNPHAYDLVHTDFDESNAILRDIIKESKEKTEDLIREEIPLLLHLTDILFEKGIMEAPEFMEVCAQHGLTVKELDVEKTVIANYVKMYDKFKQKSS